MNRLAHVRASARRFGGTLALAGAAAAALGLAACGGDAGSGDALDGDGADGDGTTGGDKADVTVGPIVSISCDAKSAFVRRGDFVEVAVDAKDAAGKASRNYVLEIAPAATARVVQRNKVIFDADGGYAITCRARDAALSDTTGVRVGALDPALAVSADLFTPPPPAAQRVRVTGRALAADGKAVKVTIGGTATALGAGGRIDATVPVTPGMNAIEVVATDGAGRSATRHAWVMAGPYGHLDRPEPNGVVVAIASSAYAQLEGLVEQIAGAIVQRDGPRAFGIAVARGQNVGVHWELHPGAAGADAPDLALTAADASMDVKIVLTNVWLTGVVKTGNGSEQGWTDHAFRAEVTRVDASGRLVATGPDTLALQGIQVQLGAIDLEIEGVPGFIESVIVWFVEGDLARSLAKAIEQGASGALGGIARGLAHVAPVPLHEPLQGTLQVETRLSGLSLTRSGLRVGLGVTVDGETDPVRLAAPGPFRVAGGEIAPSGARPYEAALHTDVLNTLLFAAWQTGALDLSFTDPEPDWARNEGDFPKVTSLDVFVEPLLPPVVRAGGEPGTFVVELGAIRVDGVLEATAGVVNTSLVAGASARVRFTAEGGAPKLTAAVEKLTADVLVAPADLEPEATRKLWDPLESTCRHASLSIL